MSLLPTHSLLSTDACLHASHPPQESMSDHQSGFTDLSTGIMNVVRLLTVKKKNDDIYSSQLRADQMPGPPHVGQLMCTLFPSIHQVKYQPSQDACRYHPHLQGSTALQAQTASGPITIDSDIDFLTPQKGCGPLSALLQGVQTRILYLQTLFFEDADVEKDPA